MAETAVAVQPNTSLPEESSQQSRYDGSRTPPDVQYEIMRRHKQDLPMKTIADQVGCDPRTVKAVIENWGSAQHTLRLEAHRSQVVDCLILGMHQAADKGKLDSLLSLSDRLGVTEAPKTQQTNVGVQVILNGGGIPSELSLAKPPQESERLQEQAVIDVGPIMPLTSTAELQPAQALTDASVTQDVAPVVSEPAPKASKPALVTYVANVQKQAVK
jgi:hypothetical protein